MTSAALPVGTLVRYGLWDGRLVPCRVSRLGKNRLPSVLTVTETIPYLCKEGAEITLDPTFWDDLPVG